MKESGGGYRRDKGRTGLAREEKVREDLRKPSQFDGETEFNGFHIFADASREFGTEAMMKGFIQGLDRDLAEMREEDIHRSEKEKKQTIEADPSTLESQAVIFKKTSGALPEDQQ